MQGTLDTEDSNEDFSVELQSGPSWDTQQSTLLFEDMWVKRAKLERISARTQGALYVKNWSGAEECATKLVKQLEGMHTA